MEERRPWAACAAQGGHLTSGEILISWCGVRDSRRRRRRRRRQSPAPPPIVDYPLIVPLLTMNGGTA